jgi:Flp pilus assembly protein CpaB
MLMFAFLNSRGGNDNTISEQLNSGAGAETVVVVARNINVGDKITADMLATRTMPAGALVDGHFKDSDAQSLVGQVAVAPLYAGEQILSSKVTTYAGQSTLTWKVPDGMRALSLTVPHESWINAGLPQPGDHVDVVGVTTFLTTNPLTGEQKPDLVGGYIAQDVLVLAIAQNVVKTVPKVDKDGKPESNSGSGAVGAQDSSSYEKAISITLALPPDLVAKVAMIDALKDDAGQFRIVTRQKGDADPISGKTTFSFEDLFPVKK